MTAAMVTRRVAEVTDTIPVIPDVEPVSRVWQTVAEVAMFAAAVLLAVGVWSIA